MDFRRIAIFDAFMEAENHSLFMRRCLELALGGQDMWLPIPWWVRYWCMMAVL
jgi:hypothetical protein